MAAHCKGKCDIAYHRVGHQKNRYRDGYKYCRLCGFYTLTSDIRCVCCTRPFRLSAKNKHIGNDRLAKPVTRI